MLCMLSIFWSDNRFWAPNISELRQTFKSWLQGTTVIETKKLIEEIRQRKYHAVMPEITHLKSLSFIVQTVMRKEVSGTRYTELAHHVLTVSCKGSGRKLELSFQNPEETFHGFADGIWSDRCCCLMYEIATQINDGDLERPFENPVLGFAVAMGEEVAHLFSNENYRTYERCEQCGKLVVEKRTSEVSSEVLQALESTEGLNGNGHPHSP